ncbi:unnamed protein product [Schistosoma margrebowiei]|uniref:Uncharacterized protein n=1 Tax=Schistosoma margrebowiei TaxID=48269 RepID=A0A183MZF0_9TREM|nr:unnamed protein product [Schistosoma margrebowiei]
MLDLRSCSAEKVYKWYRILHSKYKSSPAIFASIYLDIEGQELVPNPKIKTGNQSAILFVVQFDFEY